MQKKFTISLVVAITMVFIMAGCGSDKDDFTDEYGVAELNKATDKRVIVIGMDGLDPKIVDKLIADGRLPNFAKMRENGTLMPLGTSMPPQSPVAWSNFITGMTSGGHGLSNFVQRDPANYRTKFSISETAEASLMLEVGDLSMPLSGGDVVNLRKGEPFWKAITEAGMRADVIKIPINFPPDEYATKSISGMGTPDVKGGYGDYHYFTTDYFEEYPGVKTGKIAYITNRDGVMDDPEEMAISGPKSFFLKRDDAGNLVDAIGRPVNSDGQLLQADGTPYEGSEPGSATVDYEEAKATFKIYLDADPEKNRVARVEVGEEVIILKEGELSDWVSVDFELMPYMVSMSGSCKFYLREVYPHVKLYIGPINIDPAAPAMPISHPSEYSADLYDQIGGFATKQLPSDTKVLDERVFSDQEYVMQAKELLSERMKMFDNEWEKYKNGGTGLFFFYFSSTDLDNHMLWRTIDENHPLHNLQDDRVTPEQRELIADHIYTVYEKMDGIVGKIHSELNDNTLFMVMSDHGFSSFAREFNLNTWLYRNDYLVLKDEASRRTEVSMSSDMVDWEKTKAYSFGSNGLYINLKGRDGQGSVDPADVEALQNELIAKLESFHDTMLQQYYPETEGKVVMKVYKKDEIYKGDPAIMATLPDMIMGYNKGIRATGDSITGVLNKDVLIRDNPNMWSGDHSVDYRLVPGVYMSNKRIKGDFEPFLIDLAPTILDFLGVNIPEAMQGVSFLKHLQ